MVLVSKGRQSKKMDVVPEGQMKSMASKRQSISK
jgi:hypothetical protein